MTIVYSFKQAQRNRARKFFAGIANKPTDETSELQKLAAKLVVSMDKNNYERLKCESPAKSS